MLPFSPYLLNRASRCSLRLSSALWESTTADSKRTAPLVSVAGGLQSEPADPSPPDKLTPTSNINTNIV